jgi:hypothetical protein
MSQVPTQSPSAWAADLIKNAPRNKRKEYEKYGSNNILLSLDATPAERMASCQLALEAATTRFDK